LTRAAEPAAPPPATPPPAGGSDAGDLAVLARGGRANVFGFLLRLLARIPFLFIAGRLYGPDELGRFAYAVLVVEFAAQLATLGLRRGLAEQLAARERPDTHVVYDALLLTLFAALAAAGVLVAVPALMFPNSALNGLDRLLPLIVIAITLTDIMLAALAYRLDIAATVRARAIVEPWVLSIAALGFYFYSERDGLILAYVVSMLAAMLTAAVPLLASYGLPRAWKPRTRALSRLTRANLSLAAADAVEWGSRRLDLAILGLFVSPAVVGVYYVAQQVASLPQKLKSSFDPILGPVITRNIREGRLAAIGTQVSQAGFWILAAQLGIALALGITGEGVMGTIGPQFVGGAGALVFLLAAEVLASAAVVSEAALVYLARHRNLAISLAILALQAGLSVALILLAEMRGYGPLVLAAMPALALALSLALASLLKTRLLARIVAAPVSVWRPALAAAAAAAAIVGWGATQLPEWVELSFGEVAILGTYAAVIWRYGFGPADRALFRKGAR
jgi:O-antigen/teichoic acid export membrane protein